MKSPFKNRRAIMAAGALVLAAGGLTWSVTALADSTVHPKVSVKVDEQTIPRDNFTESGSYAPLVKRVAPSVVKVEVTERAKDIPAPDLPGFFNDPAFRQFFGEQGIVPPQGRNGRRRTLQQPRQEGLGSGVIVSSDGYILTNNHVVHDADTIKVTLADQRELDAKVVGTDPQSDLAVIKVDAKDLPAIVFADSTKVEVGDRVLAIGNPFGLGQTVTSGMVSGLSRANMGLDYEDFIQTDAAINPGNSGGALVDIKGRLVGINTAILSRSGGFQGIGFAIPSTMAKNVMQQLVETGKVIRGYMGVAVQDVNAELASAFKLQDSTRGALVAEVVPDSPAAKAGLKSGDVITELNGDKVADARRLRLAVAQIAPGKEVTLKVIRDNKPIDVKLTVGNLSKKGGAHATDEGPGGSGDDDQGTLNGVGVADLNREMRAEFDIPQKVQGVIVTEVDPTSASAEAGLQPGDVIQEINRQPVRTAEDAVKMTENPPSKKTLLRIWTRRGIRFMVIDESAKPDASQ
ncbi:MAG TPA: DegQ family serine endoprotease [Opitutaceae bacterium]|nr:DegQ family serine endoprotease [Opitutaceae bacterium]